ncbi:MAG: histone deacetylase [Actinomycetota bacterium]
MTRAVLCTTTADADRHDTGRHHPERPARLVAVERALTDRALCEIVVPLPGRLATIDELAAAHDRQYLGAIEQFIADGGGALDPDTVASAGSWDTARRAVGAGLAAIDELANTDAAAAFVGIRPPGHHATTNQAMGFCLVNNVAVVAANLRQRGQRVTVLDWDVHHGNGTQDIFWNEPDVLYVSIHEHPAYPGTGGAQEVGGPEARGTTVNIPLPEGATGDAALAAFDDIIEPAVRAFAPDWLLVSAGYDAHRADPLAGLAWSAGDYRLLTSRTAGLVPDGRLVLFLEGGYDLDALSSSVAATVAALGGVAEPDPEPPTSGGPGRDAVARTAATHRRAQEASE